MQKPSENATRMPRDCPALEALLDGLFDYAGMFPPASLSFDDCLATAASHPRVLKRSHMIAADMVISAEHLPRLNSATLDKAGFDQQRPFLVCLLGSPLGDLHGMGSHQAEVEALLRSNAALRLGPIGPQIVTYELKVSPASQSDAHGLAESCTRLHAALDGARVRVFLEPDLGGERWEAVLERLTGIICMLNDLDTPVTFGLKVRCSGPQAVSAAKLASVIETAAARGMPLKATAGLHHPIIEKARYQNEFGFLNLALALYFRRQFGSEFDREHVAACLSCSDISMYRFEQFVSFEHFSLSEQEVMNLKGELYFTIGSCSLLEPDEDLLRLLG